MVKNIVFDLGNVLISFRPAEFFEKKHYPEDIRNTILADIFASREWLQLDNGDITVDEAIESIAASSALKRGEIARIFNLRLEIMFPLTSNAKLLPGLKKRGFGLYYLSNFPSDIFADVKKSYDFFRHFDGGIISADVRLSKPDIEIYRTLAGRYSLLPEECLYVDDVDINVKAAVAAGMIGLHTNGDSDISGLLFSALEANGI